MARLSPQDHSGFVTPATSVIPHSRLRADPRVAGS